MQSTFNGRSRIFSICSRPFISWWIWTSKSLSYKSVCNHLLLKINNCHKIILIAVNGNVLIPPWEILLKELVKGIHFFIDSYFVTLKLSETDIIWIDRIINPISGWLKRDIPNVPVFIWGHGVVSSSRRQYYNSNKLKNIQIMKRSLAGYFFDIEL